MNATPQPALEQQHDSPAQAVLKRFLADALEKSAPGPGKPDGRQAEIDLRTDILYVLTDDKGAYRRALPLSRLMEEVRGLQISELASAPITDERIKANVQVLLQQRLVREFTAKENHYELAHDFLVRYVVRTYKELDRRRISQLAVLKQQQRATHEEYARLSKMGNTVSWLIRLLPVLSFGLTIGLFIYAWKESLPDLLGFAYLWVLALPGAALLLLGVAARRAAPILLAALVLLCCAGTWLYEYSESIDAGAALHLRNPEKPDCYQFAISAASSLGSDSYTNILFSRCNGISPWNDLNVRNMMWNAGGLRKKHELSPDANFCSDVSKVFGRPLGREYALLDACWQHTPDWSFYLTSVDDMGYYWPNYFHSGVAVHPYQFGQLHSLIGLFAFFLLLGHILFYPAVLLGTIQSVTVSSALRRISSEISDVVLILTTLFGLEYLLISVSSLRPLISFLIILFLVHAILYTGVSAILSAVKRSSVGTLLLKLSIINRAGSSTIPVGKLIGRSFLLWVWGVLNIFCGVPTLIITPLYVWLRQDHQLIYDSILKLRTEPKQSTEDTAASETALPQTPSHTAAAAG